MPYQTEDFRKYLYMIFLKLDDTIFLKRKKTRGLTIFKYRGGRFCSLKNLHKTENVHLLTVGYMESTVCG